MELNETLLLVLIEDIRSEVTQESWPPNLQSRSSPYDKGVNRQRLATCHLHKSRIYVWGDLSSCIASRMSAKGVS